MFSSASAARLIARAQERRVERRANTANLIRRLEEKAKADPDGIWAELLAELKAKEDLS